MNSKIQCVLCDFRLNHPSGEANSFSIKFRPLNIETIYNKDKIAPSLRIDIESIRILRKLGKHNLWSLSVGLKLSVLSTSPLRNNLSLAEMLV